MDFSEHSTPLLARQLSVGGVGIAASTARKRQERFRNVERWCSRYGYSAFPTTANILARYVLEHSELVGYHTLRSRIDAVKAVHLANAQPWFSDDPVRAALERARHAGGTRSARPLLERDMLDLSRSLNLSNDIGATHDWALIALGAAVGLDGRELCSLTRGDLVLDRNGLTLPRFTTLWLDAPSLSRYADSVRCPVAAIESWCALATTASQTLFYDLRPDHKDAPLHAVDITRIVRQRLRAIGRDPRYFGAASLKAHRFFASTGSHRT